MTSTDTVTPMPDIIAPGESSYIYKLVMDTGIGDSDVFSVDHSVLSIQE